MEKTRKAARILTHESADSTRIGEIGHDEASRAGWVKTLQRRQVGEECNTATQT